MGTGAGGNFGNTKGSRSNAKIHKGDVYKRQGNGRRVLDEDLKLALQRLGADSRLGGLFAGEPLAPPAAFAPLTHLMSENPVSYTHLL